MVLVFCVSNQNSEKSSGMSAGVIKTVVQVLPSVKTMDSIAVDDLIASLQHFVRKMAHFSIYAIGGIIAFLWLNTFDISLQKKIVFAILVCAAYAVSDEIHQLFIPGRSCELRDVCIDTLGASFGVGLVNLARWLVMVVVEKS